MTGIEYIAKERQRQIEEEWWTPEHDDEHIFGELAQAAACYAHPNTINRLDMVGWPIGWDLKWWKPSENSDIDGRIKELTKAGALIAAEIDRLLRMKPENETIVQIPDNIEEAVNMLDKLVGDADKQYILEHGSISVHRTLGRWIRVEWGLWDDSALKQVMLDKGIEHPDDMSDYIINCFIEYLKKKGEK